MTTYKKPWFKRKRTWFSLFFLICMSLFISTLPKDLPKNVVYLAKAYSEPEVTEGALSITSKNSKIIELLGNVKPIGTFDLLEGSVGYSKQGDTIAITVKLKGDKKEKKIGANMGCIGRKSKWKMAIFKY